jgi:DNA polymerase III subunit epsilon
MSRPPAPQLPIDDLTVAVVDVETTGLSATGGDRVCEVAVLRVAPGEEPILLDGLVHPGRPIGAGASAVNGITDADVANAPPFRELIPAIDVLVAGAVLVAHNAPFDLSFLAMEYGRVGAPTPAVPVLCTLTLARRHFRFPSNSLGNLAQQLGVPPAHTAHRAGSDVTTTLGVYRAIVAHLSRHGARTLGDLLAAQGQAFGFGPQAGPTLPEPLARALTEGRPVTIRYSDSGFRVTERVIRPLEVRHNRLVAWCYLRNDERTFVLERIEAVWDADAGPRA